MNDSEAPTQTAKTTLWGFSCWESSWQTTSQRTTLPAGLSTTGESRVKLAPLVPSSVLSFGPFNFRYIQSLTSNLSFVRYKEIYAAAAEIIGLTLKNLANMSEV